MHIIKLQIPEPKGVAFQKVKCIETVTTNGYNYISMQSLTEDHNSEDSSSVAIETPELLTMSSTES